MLKISSSKILSIFLILGGIPPMLSGIIAMTSANTYLNFIGAGVLSLFAGDRLGLLQVTWNLQGGDAFVAGSARVAIALLGTDSLKSIVAAIGIARSLYELWILPMKLIPWCQSTPQVECGTIFNIGVWSFIVLHVFLVLGFSWGLLSKRQEVLVSREAL